MFSLSPVKLALPVMVGLLFISVYLMGYSNGKKSEREKQMAADAARLETVVKRLNTVEVDYETIFTNIARSQVADGCPVPDVLRGTINSLPSPKG